MAERAAEALRPLGAMAPRISGETVTVPVSQGQASLLEAIHRLDAAGVTTDEIALRRPTLDEVFLKLTGSVAADAAAR